jgi:hypothetical protein
MQGRLKIAAADLVHATVFENVGLAVVSEWTFTPELETGAVVSVMDDWASPTADL